MALSLRPLGMTSILWRQSSVAASSQLITSSRGMAAGPGAKKGKGTTTGKVKHEVVTDAHKLQEYCCGSNYFLEGEDVKLKPDSEYPDWIWTMDVNRPKPRAHQMQPGTIAYYKQIIQEDEEHWRSLIKKKRIPPRLKQTK